MVNLTENCDSDSSSHLNDEEEGFVSHCSIQVCHSHSVDCGVVYLDEPAAVQRWLKRARSRPLGLHVEDVGEGALVGLGDLLQALLVASLQQQQTLFNILAGRWLQYFACKYPNHNNQLVKLPMK